MRNANKSRLPPDVLLAQVRVLRLTDELLGVAEELREARTELGTALAVIAAARAAGRPPEDTADAR
jgi:hypothetical protein